MRKLFYIIPVIVVAQACQIKDEGLPAPNESFIKYYGDLADQRARDIEILFNADSSDADGFVVFGTRQVGNSTTDYYAIRTDADGNILNRSSFGFQATLDLDGDGKADDFDGDNIADTLHADESAGQILVLQNSFVTIGTSTINNTSIGITDFSFITYALLDAQLNLLDFRALFGDRSNMRDLIGNDVIELSDGTLLFIGSKESETDLDFYYTKFSVARDSVYYERTQGFPGRGNNDVLVRAFETDEGNVVMIGYSNDTGINGETGVNVTYLEVNANGNLVKSNSNGIKNPENLTITYNEVVNDVIEKPGGYAVIGTSLLSNDQRYAFFMNLDRNGIAISGDTLTSEFGFESAGNGITQGIDNDFIAVGQYVNFQSADGARNGEAMFIRLNQSGMPVGGEFESSFGLIGGDDVAADAVTLPNGKIVVAATIDFGGGVSLISIIKLNDTGKLDRGQQ